MRLALFALFALIAGGPCAQAQEMRHLSILTGSKGGTYYRFGEDIAGVIRRECTAELRVKESNGSLANLQRLRREEAAQLAIVQQDTLEYLKEAAPEDAKLQDIIQKIRYVFPLYAEEVHLITTAGSGITDVSHLRGKRVAVGDLESGTYLTATFILLLSQVAVTPVEIGEIPALERLLLPDGASNKIDAMFFVTGKPVTLLTGRKDANRLALVNIRNPAVLQKYEAARITSNDYRWLTQSVDTVKVMSVLMSFDFAMRTASILG